MTDENRKSEATSREDVRTLNISDDNALPTGQSSTEGVCTRALRDRVHAAKRRLEMAMQYTMWSEVRVELRAAHAELAKALADIGG